MISSSILATKKEESKKEQIPNPDEYEGIDPPKKKHKHRHHREEKSSKHIKKQVEPSKLIEQVSTMTLVEEKPTITKPLDIGPRGTIETKSIPIKNETIDDHIFETSWQGPWNEPQKGNLVLGKLGGVTAHLTLACEKVIAVADKEDQIITNTNPLPKELRPKRKLRFYIVIIDSTNPLYSDRLSFCEIEPTGIISIYNSFRNKYKFQKGQSAGFYATTIIYDLE